MPRSKSPVRRSATVGLDIGSSGIRAVEISPNGAVVAAGQVGLSPGSVKDGEIRSQEDVAGALRRLWASVPFTTRRVVVAVGGQRTIVRQADVARMSAEDFRSALAFEAQDLIPIPAHEAVLDFQIVGPAQPTSSGREQMRIMLAAADRQGIERLLHTVGLADLETVAVDVVPTALLRAARLPGVGAEVGLVHIGAHLTTVVVHSTEGHFHARTLAVGAEQMTRGLSVRLGIDRAEAEAVKRYAGTDQRGSARAATLVLDESSALVEQVVESLDYFRSQTGTVLDELLLSGGGAQTVGLVSMLERGTLVPVRELDAFTERRTDHLALEPAEVQRLGTLAVCAGGLATWDLTPSEERFNLLPPEIVARRRQRRAVTSGVAALSALTVALGAAGYVRHQQVSVTQAEVTSVLDRNIRLQTLNNALASVAAYDSAVGSRRSDLTAAAAGVDWPSFIRQLTAATPPGTSLTTITLNAPAGAATGAPTAPGAVAGHPLPVLNLSVVAQGGVEQVAAWLRAMAAVPALHDVTVPSSSTSAGITSFSATATIGAKAPTITYAWEAHK